MDLMELMSDLRRLDIVKLSRMAQSLCQIVFADPYFYPIG